MMNTVQQMSSFEFQMVCVVRLLLASVCGFAIGIERTNRLKDGGCAPTSSSAWARP